MSLALEKFVRQPSCKQHSESSRNDILIYRILVEKLLGADPYSVICDQGLDYLPFHIEGVADHECVKPVVVIHVEDVRDGYSQEVSVLFIPEDSEVKHLITEEDTVLFLLWTESLICEVLVKFVNDVHGVCYLKPIRFLFSLGPPRDEGLLFIELTSCCCPIGMSASAAIIADSLTMNAMSEDA